MTDLLKDPVLDRWVLVAPDRARRPGAGRPPRTSGDVAPCPFCSGKEGDTPPETWADRSSGARDTPGWTIRVFPNKYPAAPGRHEVIVESADHGADLATMTTDEIARVLRAYAVRLDELAAMPDVRYVQLFRNAGRAAGATQAHPHAQLLALPIVPPIIREEMRGAEAVYAQRGRCVFCELVEGARSGEILVGESEAHVACSPPAPRTPCETWVLPRTHAATFSQSVATDDLAVCVGDALRRIDAVLHEPAYNLFLHQAPRQEAETPSYHWHLELLPRTGGMAAFELSTGVFINALGPREAARAMREVMS